MVFMRQAVPLSWAGRCRTVVVQIGGPSGLEGEPSWDMEVGVQSQGGQVKIKRSGVWETWV